MLKNYIKVVLRNIIKYKSYSFINIIGLAIGLTCCIFFLLYLMDELNYNKSHLNREELQFISIQIEANNSVQTLPIPPSPLGPYLKNNYPDIINFCRISEKQIVVKHSQNNLYEENVTYCDSSIFNMFTLPIVSGNMNTNNFDPTVVAISQSIADKYFKNKEAVNQNLIIDNKIFKVAAVFKNLPVNSELQTDIIIPFQNIFETEKNWAAPGQNLWIQLKKGSSYKEIESKITNVINEHTNIPNVDFKIFLHPLKDIHLYGWDGSDRIQFLYILSLVAFGILFIACINYINLATARSTMRAKEIGIRKVIGATRNIVVKQFLTESIIYSFLALAVSIILIELLLPVFNSLVDKQISFHFINVNFILILFGITLFTGILSGGYTAFVLSSYSPIQLLNSGLHKGGKINLLRKGLVVVQFIIAIILISCTLIANQQFKHIQNRNLGYNKDALIYIPLKPAYSNDKSQKELIVIKNELLNNHTFKNVSLGTLPFGDGAISGSINWENKSPDFQVLFYTKRGDRDYLKTCNLKLIEGRDFSGEVSHDSPQEYLINEAAAKLIGNITPIGKKFYLNQREGTIIGVVKDFNFQTLHKKIKPVVISYSNFRPNLLIYLPSENIKSDIDIIKKVWEKYMHGVPFEYHFMKKEIEHQYVTEKKMTLVLGYLTSLAIFISCLGLLGLSSFTAEQKTKEIGVRKVLGASVFDIILIISVNILKPVFIANIAAWPIAYLLMSHWLQDFAYRINITWFVFVLSGTVALIIAILTVSFQAIKTSIVNPIEALKYE